jgi:hypothetical protein
MKIKTSDLTGNALGWSVAKCEGVTTKVGYSGTLYAFAVDSMPTEYEPWLKWSQGGPIIDLEKLCVGYRHQPDPDYCDPLDPLTICWARTTAGGYLSYGPSLLVAAMRCYVASKLGKEVEVPEELQP